MADKRKAGAGAPGQTEQPTASPGAEAPKVFTIVVRYWLTSP